MPAQAEPRAAASRPAPRSKSGSGAGDDVPSRVGARAGRRRRGGPSQRTTRCSYALGEPAPLGETASAAACDSPAPVNSAELAERSLTMAAAPARSSDRPPRGVGLGVEVERTLLRLAVRRAAGAAATSAQPARRGPCARRPATSTTRAATGSVGQLDVAPVRVGRRESANRRQSTRHAGRVQRGQAGDQLGTSRRPRAASTAPTRPAASGQFRRPRLSSVGVGTDLDERRAPGVAQRVEHVGEPHRLAEVPAPVAGVE